jgi:ABC-type transporter Mla subunit MlaD
MFISTPYELKIPADSTVSLATAGVLGETYAEIDVKGTSGPRPRMVLY